MNGSYLDPENGGVTVNLKDVTSAFHGFDFLQTKRFQNYGRKENKRTQVGFSPLTCKKDWFKWEKSLRCNGYRVVSFLSTKHTKVLSR